MSTQIAVYFAVLINIVISLYNVSLSSAPAITATYLSPVSSFTNSRIRQLPAAVVVPDFQEPHEYPSGNLNSPDI